MQRRAITFDFHDTLVHCDLWFQLEVFHLPSAFLAWHERSRFALADPAVGVDLDRQYRRLRTAIIQHGHELSAVRSIALVYEGVGIALDDRVIEEGVDALMFSALGGIHAVPGAIETVRELADRGIALGVVSNAAHHRFLEWALEEIGLLSSFSVVVTSAAAGYYKSRPELYWHALTRLDADPCASLHIGDSGRFDVDGAARAGMRTIWLDHGGTGRPASTPSMTIRSLQGIAPQLISMLASSS